MSDALLLLLPRELPNGLISYGPDANCTIALCGLESSIYRYRPSVPANVIFLVLFFLAGVAHLIRGLRWRETTFTVCMLLGCVCEIIGYGGRLLLWQDPFSFSGFLLQIICITVAPVFYCAAIYILLSRIVVFLDPSLSRFPPKFWYAIFLPADILSLVLQASGGALSSTSTGKDNLGVQLSVAGLSFQVGTLFLFCAACVDYAVRYARRHGTAGLTRPFKLFVVFLAISIVLIFIRCAYRIEELREGYRSTLISNQGLFIALEGAMIILSAWTLLVAHPGPAFEGEKKTAARTDSEVAREKGLDSGASVSQ